MRLPESKIKKAILHSKEYVRFTALSYFSDAYSQDETIMPLVIRAVEKYGRATAYCLLRTAEYLPQTEATVEWLIGELRRDYDLADVHDDNYRFAVALIVHRASPGLIEKRLPEILSAPAFPKLLIEPLEQRLEMSRWDWDRTWLALEEFGRNTLLPFGFTQRERRHGERIVEALARHKNRAEAVLSLLNNDYRGKDETLMDWLMPSIIGVAGAMRLEAAVPLLVEYLAGDEDHLSDSSDPALQRIGTDAVVRAVDARWWDSDWLFHHSAAFLFEHIHTDLCVEKCLCFLDAEKDPGVKLVLANALTAQFSSEAIDRVWPLLAGLDEDEMTCEQWDLRYRLLAVATIIGKAFPNYEEWYEEAMAINWGWSDEDHPSRLAEIFCPEGMWPKRSGNGKK